MSTEVRPLTGLRGVAATYVVVYHFTQGLSARSHLQVLTQHGYLAVDLFFVLSGFVLAMVHGRDTFDAGGYRGFLRKRLARVYPLYAAVTLVTIGAAILAGDPPFSIGRLLVNAALIQAWGVGASIVSPAWSLSAEFAAYLLFPLLCAVLLWGSRLHAVAGAATIVLLLAFVSVHDPIVRAGPLDLFQSNTVAPLVRCLCGFSLGLLAFRLHRAPTTRWLDWDFTSTGLAVAVIGLLFVPGSDVAVALLCGPLVATLARQPRSLVGRQLSAAPVHWLGQISYAIYLTHFLLRDRMREPLEDWLVAHGVPQASWVAGMSTIAAVLVVASLAHYTIEKPARVALRARLNPVRSVA